MSIFAVVITVVYEILLEVILVGCFRLKEANIVSNPKSRLILALVSIFILYAISKFSKILFDKIRFTFGSYFNTYYKQIILILISLVFSIFYLWELNYLYDDIKKSKDHFMLITYLFIAGFLTLIVLLILSFYNNMKSQFEQKFKELEFAHIIEYTKIVESMSSDMISFRHDYLNVLQTINGFIETKDLAGLSQFYKNELLPESYNTLVKGKSYMRLKYIKIIPLKALISSKIINAESAGINVDVEIIEEIDEISISTIDICRIIGVLLDNAIEAASLTEIKSIQIAVMKNDEKVVFIIANSCLDSTPPIYKIYEKNFSTKGNGRGIGLKNVREIIDKKYDNIILNTEISNLIFKQELNIYNSKHNK